jgi:hypothetical protein
MRALALLLLATSVAYGASLPTLLPSIADTTGLEPRTRLLPLIQSEAQAAGIPPALADAVATIETGYTENALGSSGEIGLMQVMPATARMLGFRSNTTDLYSPATNIHYGVTYLARALAASGGNLCRALMKYRAGTGEEGYSPLSIQYCRRAQAALARNGSPLAEQVAATTPAAPDLADPYMIPANGFMHFRPDMAAFAQIAGDIAGENGVVVEKPVAAWHFSNTNGHARAQAVMDEMKEDGVIDPHVIHIGGDAQEAD